MTAHPDRLDKVSTVPGCDEDTEEKRLGQEKSAFYLGCDLTTYTVGAGKSELWEFKVVAMATDAWVPVIYR